MRNIYNHLKSWKKSKNSKPLMVRGARQVGKTTILKEFAKNEYARSHYFNFELDPRLNELFVKSLDPERIRTNLQNYYGIEIDRAQDVLIFDEIQESPAALNSLKYFAESEQPWSILSAGSLLGVKLSEKGFPVGKVDFLDMHPLTFIEFLHFMGEEKLAGFLASLTLNDEIVEPIHEKLLELFYVYVFLGGMPEVVAHYAKNRNLKQARQIQKNILASYLLDFAKHAPKDHTMRINEVYASLPKHLAKENKKFIFSAIRSSGRARDYSIALQWLKDASLILKVENISNIQIPLLAHAEEQNFKIYASDVGLLGALLDSPTQLMIDNEHIFTSYVGALSENVLAQELVAHGAERLFFWTSSGNAEVDFIFQNELKTIAAEVKSSSSGKMKSLQVLHRQFPHATCIRVLPQNLRHQDWLTNIPIYAAHLVRKF